MIIRFPAIISIACLLLVGCASTNTAKLPTPTLSQAESDYQKGNYQQALTSLTLLAINGNADAQYALGYMYYYGQGTRQNLDLARGWFREAALSGLDKAQQALNMLDRSILHDVDNITQSPVQQNPALMPEAAADNTQTIAQQHSETSNVQTSNTEQWAVQLGVFADQNNADRLATQLRHAGHPVHTSKIQSENRQLTYVLVGSHSEYEQAANLVNTLYDTVDIEGIVINTHQFDKLA